jgi:hypothetical protein
MLRPIEGQGSDDMDIFWIGLLGYTLLWSWVLLPVDRKVLTQRISFFIGWQMAPLLGFFFSDTSLDYLLQVVAASGVTYILVRFTLNTQTFLRWRQQCYSVQQD